MNRERAIDPVNLIKRASRAFLRAPVWSATGRSGPDRPPCLEAGRRNDLHWWGFGQAEDIPTVIITGQDVLLRPVLALLWDLTDGELEEIGDRWLRRPLEPFRRQNPDVVPAVQVGKEFKSLPADPVLVDVATNDGRRIAYIEAGRRPWRCVWEVGVDDLELHIPKFDGFTFSLRYRDDPVPFVLPPDDEVVDLIDLWQRTRPRRTRRRPARLSQLKILPPEGKGDEDDDWVVQDYTLAEDLRVRSGYEAQSLVQAELAREDRQAFERVHFDSEGGCFVAYCESAEDAESVRRAVERLLGAS